MIGNEIKAMRLKLKLGQEAFARTLGVSTRTVCRWEKSGDGLIHPHRALKLRLENLVRGSEVSAERRQPTSTTPASSPVTVIRIELGEKTLDVLRSLVFALEKLVK